MTTILEAVLVRIVVAIWDYRVINTGLKKKMEITAHNSSFRCLVAFRSMPM